MALRLCLCATHSGWRGILAAIPDTSECPRSGLRTLRDRLPAIVLGASLAIVFLVKYLTVTRQIDMGCDIATYLATMNAFFGQDPTGLGLDRPPLIALPLKLFTLIFGNLNGVKLLGVLLSVAIGIPFYLIAKRVCQRWIAIAMTIVFVLTPAYSDMLTWGYLTMFGILFAMLTLYFFILLLEKPSKLNLVLTGACASFIVGFHQLSLAFFVPLFFLFVSALLAFNRQGLQKNYKAAVGAVVIGIVLSIPYLPIYLRMLQMQAPATSEVLLSLTPSYLPWILGIVLSLPLVVLALKWTWQQDRTIAIMSAVLLVYSLVLILFVFPPPFLELNRRAHYFMYPAIWLLAGVVLSHLWSWKTVRISTVRRWLPKAGATALMVALLAFTLVMSQLKLDRGLDFFGYLDDTRWDAVSLVRDYTRDGASIAAYPEPLGWWIEAESERNTATVTDRNTVPYVFLRERSLTAERVLSRNQGLENGNLRLATTYPYSGTPGQPVLGVYVGGSYHDVMMFDDSSISLSMESGEIANLAADSQREFSISGDGESMTMTTIYQTEGAKVVQTATLHRDSQTAVISYNVQRDGASVTGLDVPVFFGFEPKSVSIDADQHSIEVLQYLRMQTDRVVTHINIGSEGATLQMAATKKDRVDLSFNIQNDQATITFSFDVAEPDFEGNGDVTHYEVPQIIREPALEHLSSIDYLAIDLKPNPHLASDLPLGLEQWLNACPYYKLIYSEGDIRIYQVDTSALP
jgi:hypothetical protein